MTFSKKKKKKQKNKTPSRKVEKQFSFCGSKYLFIPLPGCEHAQLR